MGRLFITEVKGGTRVDFGQLLSYIDQGQQRLSTCVYFEALGWGGRRAVPDSHGIDNERINNNNRERSGIRPIKPRLISVNTYETEKKSKTKEPEIRSPRKESSYPPPPRFHHHITRGDQVSRI